VEDKALKSLDILGVEMLLGAHDAAVLDSISQAQPHAEAFPGRPMPIFDGHQRAGVIGFMHDTGDLKSFLVKRAFDELETLAQILLAERTGDERHSQAVDIHEIENVVRELRQRAFEIAGSPALKGPADRGTIAVERHGVGENHVAVQWIVAGRVAERQTLFSAHRIFEMEDEPLEGFDVGGIVMLVHARDQAIAEPRAKADAEPDGFPRLAVRVVTDNRRAAVVGFAPNALGPELVDGEGVEQELQALADILLAERARGLRHCQTIDIHVVADIVSEEVQQALEIARRPADVRFFKCRKLGKGGHTDNALLDNVQSLAIRSWRWKGALANGACGRDRRLISPGNAIIPCSYGDFTSLA